METHNYGKLNPGFNRLTGGRESVDDKAAHLSTIYGSGSFKPLQILYIHLLWHESFSTISHSEPPVWQTKHERYRVSFLLPATYHSMQIASVT